MLKKVLSVACVLALTVSCSKKKKADEVLPEVPNNSNVTQDSNVSAKDMNYDAQGSDSGSIAGLNTLHFEYDKASLTSDSRGLAQKNADWLKAHAGATVQIEGHCDQHGSIEYNLALGERRAKAAKTYMVNLGVDSKRLTTISYGKEKPLDNSGSESADSKNRRANFVPQGK